MSMGEVKKVSPEEIQEVQNLVEMCLQLYMSKEEAVNKLHHHASIEPCFTEIVWRQLELQNHNFFKQYHLTLALKRQTMQYNELLQKYVELMGDQMPPATATTSLPISNVPILHQNSSWYTPDNTTATMELGNMQQSRVSYGGPSHMQSNVGMPNFSGTHDVPQNITMCQNSSMQGQPFMYNANNVVETHTAIAEVAIIGQESNLEPVNNPIVEPETSLFGFVDQVPRNFSSSDLMEYFYSQ